MVLGLFERKKDAPIAPTLEQQRAEQKREEVVQRMGLLPEDAKNIVMEKQRTPPKDTRKSANEKSAPLPGMSVKPKKKKKVKDPKELYAEIKAAEEKALCPEDEEEKKTTEDSILSQWHDCVRCMESAEMRPLVGNDGTYLCYTCYWSLHPEIARKEAEGGSEKVKEVVEGEECRSCLGQGYIRRCCNEFYCHQCFLKTGLCPGCDTPCSARGLVTKKDDPGPYPVLATWVLSVTIVTVSFLFFGATVANEFLLPTTIWDYSCHGYFPSCDVDVCVDLNGTAVDGIKSAAHYPFCDVHKTVNKIRGKVCVYDEELFKQSQNTMGYDFCYDVRRPEQSKKDEFLNGVFVFEENFDYWRNKTDYTRESVDMASAQWATMTNHFVTDFCGINLLPSSIPYPRIGDPGVQYGVGALVFSGVKERRAVTIELDMTYGGFVDFYLKFAPIVDDEEKTLCKTAYGGDVAVAYSIDGGANWVIFGSYKVYLYRSDDFNHIYEELPEEGWTNRTMFRWSQEFFEAKRDYFALDDIKIFHRFSPNWRQEQQHLNYKRDSDLAVQKAQCCFETEHCENDPSDFLNPKEDCDYIKGYRNKNYYILRGADAYIVIAALLALVRSGYNFIAKLFAEGDALFSSALKKYMPKFCRKLFKRKKKASLFSSEVEINPADELPPGVAAEGAFECLTNPNFTRFISLALVGPFVFLTLWMISVTNQYQVYQPFVSYRNKATKETSIYVGEPPYVTPDDEIVISSGFVIFLCIWMDFDHILWLAKNVFCVLKRWVPLINIDTNPRLNYLKVGDQRIVLTDIKEIHRFSKSFAWTVTILYLFGAIPWCALTMVFKSFWMNFFTARLLIGCVGFIACFRAFFGAAFCVKFFFAMDFLLATNKDLRDEMGRSMKEEKVKYMVFYCSLVSACSTGLLIGTYYFDSALRTFAAAICAGIFGGIFGASLAMMQGLPTMPHFKITIWPDEGHFVQYTKKFHCPCLFYFGECSELHTRTNMLVLFLDNMQSYQSLLKGEPDGSEAI